MLSMASQRDPSSWARNLSIVGDRFQPRFLPVEQAACLATAVSRSVTPRFKMNRSRQPGAPIWIAGRIVAGLVGTFVHAKLLPAKLKHFGHKRHAIELSASIKGLQNFFFTADFHHVANAWLLFMVFHLVPLRQKQCLNVVRCN